MPDRNNLQTLEQMKIQFQSVFQPFKITKNISYLIVLLHAFFTFSFLFHKNTFKGLYTIPAPGAIPGTQLMLSVYLLK